MDSYSDESMDSTTGMACVAFGPNGQFVAIPEDSDYPAFWSSTLADDLMKKNKKTIVDIAFAMDNQYYVEHDDGSSSWSLHPDLSKLIKKVGVTWITFGPSGTYVFKCAEGVLHWWGIPAELEKHLKSNSNDDCLCVSLGQNDSYVVIFKSSYYWCGVPERLSKALNTKRNGKTKIDTFDYVWLSAYDSRYYLEYNGGAAIWSGCSEYFDSMMQCDQMMNPLELFYTNDSISATFSDGKSIYDTARDLNNGKLSITEVPMMEVFAVGDSYFSKNNRRLWSFRNSGVKLAPMKTVKAPKNSNSLPKRRDIYVRYRE
eukprot:TRINITY_DN34195_c0_g1_i1.p1 TRINITY_DN34195_c0_g1~~TRINITY_DN34195_c0_g1_i1.p1  ORF type:complete len:315 (-),score=17.80 TRINITY_DN34195_c0_g1_i1:201-1145(-)